MKKRVKTKYRGTTLIMAMILLVVCSALAVSMAAMVGTNIQIASNHHKINSALYAAESGLECGKFLITKVTLPKTNNISTKEANQAWNVLYQQLQNMAFGGRIVRLTSRFSDSIGNGDQILTAPLNYNSDNTNFQLRFYRYDSNPYIIKFQSIGTCGEIVRKVNMDFMITKNNEVLKYAIASRGRIWLTGDTTIYGDIFSAWDCPEMSPYNMTSDSAVYGTINTTLTLEQINHQSYQLETLNTSNESVNQSWFPLGSNFQNRYYGNNDQIRAYHQGINYGQFNDDIPGISISDYNTDTYNSNLTEIENCPISQRETEYFPHAPDNYRYPRDGTPYNTWNRRFRRHVYENQTFVNARLPSNRNALFRNCTFKEILYIDCNKSAKNYYNNVRFENCTFNGIIVTNVPQSFEWQCNVLYFTGESIFRNRSEFQEAIILAPHFNVDLGNTNPDNSENNILTGTIIGGIVDVHSNAEIHGTIISMCDTSQWPSGYVTNIGSTLDDGGSETADLGNIGKITITPNHRQMLPSGIAAPIIIKHLRETYSEG